MLRKFSCSLVLMGMLGLCTLYPAAPLNAKTSSADITCEALLNLASNPATTQVSAYIFYWIPGWWAAMHNEPYINDWRRSLLSEAIINQCRKSDSSRILDAVRSVKKLPDVPDNALKITCKNFMDSEPPWQAMTIFWLQGYIAYQKGHTRIHNDYLSVYNPVFEMCLKDESALRKRSSIKSSNRLS